MTIGLLISGNLGLIILKRVLSSHHKILFAFTDSGSKAIIETCEVHQLPVFKGNPRNGRSAIFLEEQQSPDLVLSVNYPFIIEKDIIKKAKLYSINIHGSLLPKYRGRTPHVWAIINNEKTAGITAHLINDECDAGDIVDQEEIPIKESYTGQDLLNVFNERYPEIAERIIRKVEEKSIQLIPQDHSVATYFPKRTPEDGKINWEWQKERIFNWVRAQSKPYPGAFSIIKDKIVKIHKIEFSDLGYHHETKNGTVIKLTQDHFFVKTSNGVIKITDFETDNIIVKGDICL